MHTTPGLSVTTLLPFCLPACLL
jgi:pimeloyl-ACP methyl ester carboxylesterase